MIHVIEAAPVGMIKVDAQGKIILVNRELERMFQYSREEMLGSSLDMLIPERYRPEHSGHMSRFAEKPAHRQMGIGRDLRGRRRDGSEFPIDVALNPVEMPTGPCVIASVIDVTEQRRAKAELERLNATLAEKNAELERFVLTVSHDLKSPLVTILGYIGHLRRDVEQSRHEELSAYASRIEAAAHRMKQKIDDLLKLSRIGRGTSIGREVDLLERVSAAIAARRDEIGAKQITVSVDLQSPTVWCDPGHVDQILDNLLGNAIRYGCTAKTPQINIRSRSHSHAWVELSVEDNGVGIDPKYAERVFELFQRLSTEGDGTGVGLAIIRRIAGTYGGRAWVESMPGQGAKFRISLPRLEPSGAPVEDRANPGAHHA